MTIIFEELLDRFEASGVLVAIREHQTGSAYLWEGAREAPAAGVHVSLSDVHPPEHEAYLDTPADGWRAEPARGRDGGTRAVGLDAGGRHLPADLGPAAAAIRDRHGARALVSAALAFGADWSGRVILLDPKRRSEEDLRSLQSLVRQLAPAVENVYLLRRLRTRAGAAERARVARELHDGVIQSLIGLEMRVDVLRQQALARGAQDAAPLADIQDLLRGEVVAVRELMEQMRPVDVGPRDLLDHLAVMVDKFRRESGIASVFVSELSELTLPPRVCREVARIVQEALVNVRKHAAASNVLVRLDRQDGCCVLVVDDDGRGFDFRGRVSQAALDAERKGPMVIKERVREAGGEMSIDSTPGHGSRLEIRIPERARG
jgi:two-component system nitrate/nitrite sensor histidine kinase NarX